MRKLRKLIVLAILSTAVSTIQAQTSAAVPRLVSFSGKTTDARGKIVSGVSGVTFAIYSEQTGSAPLWIETQTITADAKGNYSAQLGATKPAGLPLDLFTSGEARWLGVRINGGEEQPRVLLLSVPYALKAADAETIGGLPPSAFVLAAPIAGAQPAAAISSSGSAAPPVNPNVTGVGIAGSIPLWDSASDITSSAIVQTGSGSTARIGINTTPSTTLDVKGTTNFRGTVTMPSGGLATASAGKASYPFVFATSAYNTSAKASVLQNFRWQAEPVNNNSASATGKLNLLFSSGTGTPVETGLSIASNGQLSFATGQAFPGTGTISGVTAGKGLTGGGATGSVTLNLDLTRVPLLASTNTFTGNQTVSGNLSSTGVVSGSAFQIGSNLFAFGSLANGNSFLGFGGNTTMTGNYNIAVGTGAFTANTSGISDVAVGYQALPVNTTGSNNVAVGRYALDTNVAGGDNTATGYTALFFNLNGNYNAAYGSGALASNSSGNQNTAIGTDSLDLNVTGSGNTAIGVDALALGTETTLDTAVGNYSGFNDQSGTNNTYLGYASGTSAGVTLSNATAIGATTRVSESNALILGNNASVGIGTPTPYLDYGLTVDTTSSSRITGGVVVNATTGNLYLGMIQGVHKFRVDISGAVWADGGFNTGGADFAESVAVRGSRSEYEPGDVLEIDRAASRGLTLSHHPYATLVAGIYSTRPGVLASPHTMDETAARENEVPLAVVGIVPCKVTTENGAIAPGDLLVTSSRAGYAMKGTNRRRLVGAVVGKALEPLSKGSGVIQVLVTLQ